MEKRLLNNYADFVIWQTEMEKQAYKGCHYSMDNKPTEYPCLVGWKMSIFGEGYGIVDCNFFYSSDFVA